MFFYCEVISGVVVNVLVGVLAAAAALLLTEVGVLVVPVLDFAFDVVRVVLGGFAAFVLGVVVIAVVFFCFVVLVLMGVVMV